MTRTIRQERLALRLTAVDRVGEVPFGSVGLQLNKVLDQLNKGYYSYRPVESWTPAVNLYETNTSYLVCVDLAGVDKEKIEITVVGQRLTFRGNRQVPAEPPRDADAIESPPKATSPSAHARIRVHLMEVDHGAFSRDVELPEDVESEQITATYRNGLLWIELPRVISAE